MNIYINKGCNYLVFSGQYLRETSTPPKVIHERPNHIADNVAAILVNCLQHLGYVVLLSKRSWHQADLLKILF